MKASRNDHVGTIHIVSPVTAHNRNHGETQLILWPGEVEKKIYPAEPRPTATRTPAKRNQTVVTFATLITREREPLSPTICPHSSTFPLSHPPHSTLPPTRHIPTP